MIGEAEPRAATQVRTAEGFVHHVAEDYEAVKGLLFECNPNRPFCELTTVTPEATMPVTLPLASIYAVNPLPVEGRMTTGEMMARMKDNNQEEST